MMQKLFGTRRRTGAVAAVGMLALTAGLVGWAGQASGSGPTPSPLQSVSTSMLDASNIELTTPKSQDAAKATVTKERAEGIARSHFGEGPVLESGLLQVVDRLSEPAMSCFCWVVSSAPVGGVYIHQPPPQEGKTVKRFVPTETFRLDFIDAVTGKWLYAAEGAHGADE